MSRYIGQLSVEAMSQIIIDRTMICEVIEREGKLFIIYDAEDLFLDSENVIEFCDGIVQGYEFIIGINTYINYLRRAHGNFSDYLLSARHIPGHLPACTTPEKRRMNQVRSGKGRIDKWTHGKSVQNSSQLAEFMEDLLQKEHIRIEDSGDGTYHASSENTD